MKTIKVRSHLRKGKKVRSYCRTTKDNLVTSRLLKKVKGGKIIIRGKKEHKLSD